MRRWRALDGQRLISTGEDGSVHVWVVSADNAIAAARLGGEGLVPFLNMLEGGPSGELLRDMEDYFYFMQVRLQGVASRTPFTVSATVPLAAVADLMRAVGFFPSEEEIQNMLAEVKFSDYVETGQHVAVVDLATYVRLYVNHRPVGGLAPSRLQAAFRSISASGDVETATLLDELQRRGEHMTAAELQGCLAVLVGDAPQQRLRERLAAPEFAADVLGF